MRLSWLSSIRSAADTTEMDISFGMRIFDQLTSIPLDLTSF